MFHQFTEKPGFLAKVLRRRLLVAVRAATETEKDVDIDAVLKDLQTKVEFS